MNISAASSFPPSFQLKPQAQLLSADDYQLLLALPGTVAALLPPPPPSNHTQKLVNKHNGMNK